MAKRWRIHPHDSQRIAWLERAAGVPSVVAQLLLCRGIDDPQRARDFLEVRLTSLRPPEELPGAAAAAETLWRAIQDRRRIVVYGDYDADGITGTALLWQCLKLLGADATYYLPNRLDEGYGLNNEALRNLAKAGAQVLVTVDCGIASRAEAETARELGLELVITDHHDFGPQLPEARAIVHPRLPGTAYPFGGLSGSAVAFKVAWALCQQASQAKRVDSRMKTFLMQAMGLAALGVVADVVPLVDENRTLVRHGLASIKQSTSPGMMALLKLTNLTVKPQLECEDIAFSLAPRLNAAGRFGQAQLAVELLTTTSTQRADALAEYLHELNASRESLERSIYLGANKQIQQSFDPDSDAALVLADHDWHAGVIGIVAGRLAEKYNRPVVLIALDPLGVKPGVGSARGVPGLNLHQALAACTQHLVSHGGHAAAAGLKVQEANLEAFRADFCEHVDSNMQNCDAHCELWIDAETPFSALTLVAVEHLERLAPFGHGNTRPVLCTTGVSLHEPVKRMGNNGRHLGLKLAQHGVKLRCVAFGNGDWADPLTAVEGPLEIAFRPVINDFRGRRSVELQLVDWRMAEPAATTISPQRLPA